jgi:hypothetical protein
MKTLYKLLLQLILLGLASCEDVVDINPEMGKKTLVVEGWLTNRAEPDFVNLYYTASMSSNEFSKVAGAKVTLRDNGGNIETLPEVSTGKYKIPTFKATEGKTYTLSIESTAGNYEAVAEVNRLSMHLDSLTFRFEKKSAIYEKEGYYPLSNGQESAGKGDYMMVRMFRNGVFLNKTAGLNLFEDTFVDGNYIGKAELAVPEPYAKNEVAKAEVWSLTEDAFHFWVDIQSQLQNGQMFAMPLSNTRTNVKKKSPNAIDVVGYFGASLVNSKEAVVK